METHTVEKVSALFLRYIPATDPDKKLVKYWANALAKGDKDMDDLLGYIAKHTEYINHIKYAFTDMYYEHLSSQEDTDIGKLFDRMVASEGVDRPLTLDDVWVWLSNTEMFERQYSDIIAKLFDTFFTRPPTETERKALLSRLRTSRAYTVDMLQRDIERSSAAAAAAADNADILHMLAGGTGNASAARESRGDGGDATGDMTGDAAAMLLLGVDGAGMVTSGGNGGGAGRAGSGSVGNNANKGTAGQVYEDMEIVDAYEAVFNRNMNVREYILYIDELRHANRSADAAALDEHITMLHDAHSSIFNSVKEIMQVYVDRYTTEDEFIGHYLARAHNPDFLNALKREVFDSQEYQEKMSERLMAIYYNLYGEKMTADDAVFLFRQVKHRRMELVSDALNETVAAFKAENDEVLQRIFDIFFDVFDREPDGAEQQKYVAFIRDKKSAATADDDHDDDDDRELPVPQAIDDAIVLDLKQSLEYHDVLKKKITKAYAKFSKDVLFPSKVYQVLDKIVPIKHYKDVDAHIDAAVQELLLDATTATAP